jgi:hypothetical protein
VHRGLASGCEAALAQDLNRFLFVSLSISQRLLAFHHARARLLTQRLDCRRRNLCHNFSSHTKPESKFRISGLQTVSLILLFFLDSFLPASGS